MTSRLWLEQVKEMGLPSADPGQGSCTAPATEEAPDSGEECVTAHTRVTWQGWQWKPEGRGERERGAAPDGAGELEGRQDCSLGISTGLMGGERADLTKESSNQEFRLPLRQDLLALEPAGGGASCL